MKGFIESCVNIHEIGAPSAQNNFFYYATFPILFFVKKYSFLNFFYKLIYGVHENRFHDTFAFILVKAAKNFCFFRFFIVEIKFFPYFFRYVVARDGERHGELNSIFIAHNKTCSRGSEINDDLGLWRGVGGILCSLYLS